MVYGCTWLPCILAAAPYAVEVVVEHAEAHQVCFCTGTLLVPKLFLTSSSLTEKLLVMMFQASRTNNRSMLPVVAQKHTGSVDAVSAA